MMMNYRDLMRLVRNYRDFMRLIGNYLGFCETYKTNLGNSWDLNRIEPTNMEKYQRWGCNMCQSVVGLRTGNWPN